MSDGDTYRRRLVDDSPDIYRCGCRWTKHPDFGDVLVECPIHRAMTVESVKQHDRALQESRDRVYESSWWVRTSNAMLDRWRRTGKDELHDVTLDAVRRLRRMIPWRADRLH